MQQALPFPKRASLLMDESEEKRYQKVLDLLSLKKLSWEHFFEKVADFSRLTRLVSRLEGRSLLHLAVLDERLDVIEALKGDSALKLRPDHFGLSSLELAQLLDRKEMVHLLRDPREKDLHPPLPKIEPFKQATFPIFESREEMEKIMALVGKAKKGDRIPAEKIWMGVYFDKELRQGAQAPISIQWIDPTLGYGVFAHQKILPCAYVGEYTGMIRERSPKQTHEKKYCLRYTTWDGKKNFVIDAEERGNFTRFINHSDKPNLGLQSVYWRGIPRMIFVALQEIEEGEQLTFDYGPLFWKQMRQTPQRIG